MAAIDPNANEDTTSVNDEEFSSWILYTLYGFIILSNLIAIVLHWVRYRATDSGIHAIYITAALGVIILTILAIAHVVKYWMIAIIELGILVVCFYLFGVWVKSMNNYLKGYTSDILYFISQGLMIIFFLSGIAVIGIYEIYVGKPDVHEPTIWERYLPGGLMIVSSAIQLIIGIALFIRIRPGTDARLRLKYKQLIRMLAPFFLLFVLSLIGLMSASKFVLLVLLLTPIYLITTGILPTGAAIYHIPPENIEIVNHPEKIEVVKQPSHKYKEHKDRYCLSNVIPPTGTIR